MVVATEVVQNHDTLISKVEAARVAKEAARVERRRAVVIAFTDGQIADADELSSALEDCGMTPAELLAAKDVLMQRRVDFATMEHAKANDARRSVIIQRRQEIADEIKRLTAGLYAESQTLAYEAQTFSQDAINAATAADRLRRTAEPELKAELAEVLRQIKETEAVIAPIQRQLEDRIHAGEGFLASTRDERATDMRLAEAAANLKESQRVIGEIQKKLKPLAAKLDGLGQRSTDILERMMQP